MKKNKLLTLICAALVGLGSAAWAGPRGGGGGFGGGGHFAAGGRSGGFAGGGSRAAPAFHGGGARFGSFARGGFHPAPNAFRGARLSSRSFGAINRSPRFSSGRAGLPALRDRSMAPVAGRTSAISRQQNRAGLLAGRSATINRQQNRAGSLAARNRATDPRSAVHRAIANNRVAERHDANWHRDWDKHRAHFHNNVVFVFVNGFWWGLYPWDYYPYYAYDYYPYDYYGYPYDDSGYYPYDYDDQSAYVDSGQYGNGATVSAVQSALAKLGYYDGAIDGVVGDETQAAVARYQEDHDLSVTGTLTAATLQSLGLARTAS